MLATFNTRAVELRDEITGLASRLIRTPSISGTEGDIAALIARTMTDLGYDEVFTDKIGNVVGIIKGDGTGPSVMFNSHMDHVDPGEESLWEYAPYGGEIADGFVHGRAASDVKSGLASQIYAGYMLKNAGKPLKGDFIFTGVVQEEPAEMFGMRHLCDTTLPEKGITFDLMVSSEATNLDLSLGHRGRAEIEVVTYGRTSHGSAPWRGVNAVYKMLPVLEQVQVLADSLPDDPFLGRATCTLTRISCSPGELSITPDKCVVSLDRRLVRGETKEDALSEIQAILDTLASQDPDFKAEVRMRTQLETSYTGVSAECEKIHARLGSGKGQPRGAALCPGPGSPRPEARILPLGFRDGRQLRHRRTGNSHHRVFAHGRALRAHPKRSLRHCQACQSHCRQRCHCVRVPGLTSIYAVPLPAAVVFLLRPSAFSCLIHS